jgi:hypothetical protein
VRDGINIARYALKLAAAAPEQPADLSQQLYQATTQILGLEALDYLPGARPDDDDDDDDL